MATSTAVKFYSVSALPSTPTNGGIYFVQGGELYKETQRFGLARVYKYAQLSPYSGEGDAPYVWNNNSSWTTLNKVTGMERGDLAIGDGAAKVYDGAAWQPLGADSSATDELAARVSAIETVVSVVTSVPEGEVEPVTTTTVSADSGYFTNLSVSDATFGATSISASTLTVGGVEIWELASTAADAEIAAITSSTATSTSNGITVGVTTSSGGVTMVTVDAAAFANVMHFKGVVNESSSGSPNLSGYDVGDIILIGSQANIGWYNIGTGEAPATGELTPGEKEGTGYTPASEGQEYICIDVDQDGHCKWELIGDQNTGATKGYVDAAIASALAYLPGIEAVTSNATTLDGAVHAIAGAIDSKVTTYDTYDSSTQDGELVTAGAVRNLVENITASSIPIDAPGADIDWEGPIGIAIGSGTTVSNVQNAIEVLNAAISDVSSTLNEVSATTVPFVAEQGYSGTILSTINAASSATIYSAIETLDAAITTLSASLGDAAYLSVATSIGPSVSISGVPAQGEEGQEGYVPATPSVPAADHTKLATERAVRDAIDAARTEFQMVWYDDDDVNTGN